MRASTGWVGGRWQRCSGGRDLTGAALRPILCLTMPSIATAKEIPARSPLSGHPVGPSSLLALNLLGLLLLLAR